MATAATTRIRALFPPHLADRARDRLWTEVAELVRFRVGTVVATGDYPFEAFYRQDRDVVELLVARICEVVFGALPPGAASLDDIGDAVGVLVRHRLEVTPADAAGRLLSVPSGDFDLLVWAGRIRMVPVGKAADDLLAFGDQELSYFVSRRQDAVVAEMTSRSRQRWLLGNFASEQDALRFLVMRIGADLRSQLGRRPLSGGDLVTGVTLEDGPTATHLTWSGGWADFPKGLAGRAAALSFGRVADLPPARIAALYESPHGGL